jgi:hypothetical protein
MREQRLRSVERRRRWSSREWIHILWFALVARDDGGRTTIRHGQTTATGRNDRSGRTRTRIQLRIAIASITTA